MLNESKLINSHQIPNIPFQFRNFVTSEQDISISDYFFRKFYLEPIIAHNPDFRNNSYEQSRLENNIIDIPLLISQTPEEVFGEEPLYHVTASGALQSILAGKPLLPPISHPLAGIETQRKSGLFIADALLDVFVGDMSTKRTGVFASRYIDAQQVIGEQMLTQHPSDWLQKNVICKKEEKDIVWGTPVYYFHDELIKCLQSLEATGSLKDVADTTKAWLQGTLFNIFNRYLVREGWYASLKQLFEGERTISNFDFENAKIKLYNALFDWEEVQENRSNYELFHPNAVILRINQKNLNKMFDIYNPVLFGGRDPRTIRYMPYVPSQVIDGVYFYNEISRNELNLIKKKGIEVGGIEDIPQSVWLAGKTPHEVGSWTDVDPLNPLCDIRYDRVKDGDLSNFWKKQILADKLTYAWNFYVNPTDLKTNFGIVSPSPILIGEVISTLRLNS